MKIKQITLAVLALTAVGACSAAYADDANSVTIYGYVRAGVVNFNGAGNSAWGYAGNGASTSSTNVAGRAEINFKGTENLGNGLSSVWQVSNRFSPTGNGKDDQDGSLTGFATNDTFVGLKSSTLGTLVMGTNYGNFEDGKYDNSVVVGPDQIQGWFGDTEGHNMVRYDLPTFAGINSSIQYGTSENKSASFSGNQLVSLNVNYDNGFWGVSGSFCSTSNVAVGSGITGQTATFGWASNTGSVGTLGQAHLTAMIKPTDALQLAVEFQRDSLQSDSQTKSALYAYYTIGAAQVGVQGGYESFSGDKVAGLQSGKFYDAFLHYNMSKTTMAYIEVMDSKDGYVGSNTPNTNRVMTDIGLNKSF